MLASLEDSATEDSLLDITLEEDVLLAIWLLELLDKDTDDAEEETGAAELILDSLEPGTNTTLDEDDATVEVLLCDEGATLLEGSLEEFASLLELTAGSLGTLDALGVLETLDTTAADDWLETDATTLDDDCVLLEDELPPPQAAKPSVRLAVIREMYFIGQFRVIVMMR